MNKKEITAVCAFVFDKDGNILAVKNSRGWDIPGGNVEQGESPDRAVIREVFEEASVIVDNAQLFHIQEFSSLGWRIAYYHCNLIEIKTFQKEFETTHREFMSISDFLSVYGGEDLKETDELIAKAQEVFNTYSASFDFLKNEPELYSKSDLRKRY